MDPYAVPTTLTHDLAQGRAFWDSLRRGPDDRPLSEGAVLAQLGALADQAFTLQVLVRPLRFRFGEVGARLRRRHAGAAAGGGVDEIAPEAPFHLLLSQCSATYEQEGPTCYAHHFGSADGYARLLLPTWRDGRIDLLIGLVEWG